MVEIGRYALFFVFNSVCLESLNSKLTQELCTKRTWIRMTAGKKEICCALAITACPEELTRYSLHFRSIQALKDVGLSEHIYLNRHQTYSLQGFPFLKRSSQHN